MIGAGDAPAVGYITVFAPTDEQLLIYFLLPYNKHNIVPNNCPDIQLQNVYSIPPDALLAGRHAGHFLTLRPRKHQRGSRVSRDAGNGSSWKQGKIKKILGGQDGQTVIGQKTWFYCERFVLHEYELSPDLSADADKVLCKIMRSNNKRNRSTVETDPRPAKKTNSTSSGWHGNKVYDSNDEYFSDLRSYLEVNSGGDGGVSSSMNFAGNNCSQLSAQEMNLQRGEDFDSAASIAENVKSHDKEQQVQIPQNPANPNVVEDAAAVDSRNKPWMNRIRELVSKIFGSGRNDE